MHEQPRCLFPKLMVVLSLTNTQLVLNLGVIGSELRLSGAIEAVMDVHRAASEGVVFVGCVFVCMHPQALTLIDGLIKPCSFIGFFCSCFCSDANV